MDPITLALIVGLGSGVLGGIASQLVAGYFKTRGDTRQITAAREAARAAEVRWEREQQFEREKLTHETLRAACVRYLQYEQALQWLYLDAYYQTSDFNPETWESSKTQAIESMYGASAELVLIAPGLKEPLFETQEHLFNLETGPDSTSSTDWDKERDRHAVKLEALRRAMRSELGIAESEKKSHNQPQLNEANPSGTSKPIKP